MAPISGGTEDEYVYQARTAGDRGGQRGNLILINGSGGKAPGDAASSLMPRPRSDLLGTGPIIDRDGKAIRRQAPASICCHTCLQIPALACAIRAASGTDQTVAGSMLRVDRQRRRDPEASSHRAPAESHP